MAGVGGLPDWISVGVLAASVPRDAVDEAVAGRQALRSDGKLPPHVMVHFAMAMALFADDDYEGVLARLAEPLAQWGCWDRDWAMPGSAGITQARQRLGAQVVREVFERVARTVCEVLTRGAWLAGRRMVSIDGFECDVPDSPANAQYFGYAGGAGRSAFPKVRVVSLVETGSHAPLGAAIGPIVGKGLGEQSLARDLFGLLEPGMVLLADRNFSGWPGWCAAGDTGADLMWRVSQGGGGNITLPGACPNLRQSRLIYSPVIDCADAVVLGVDQGVDGPVWERYAGRGQPISRTDYRHIVSSDFSLFDAI